MCPVSLEALPEDLPIESWSEGQYWSKKGQQPDGCCQRRGTNWIKLILAASKKGKETCQKLPRSYTGLLLGHKGAHWVSVYFQFFLTKVHFWCCALVVLVLVAPRANNFIFKFAWTWSLNCATVCYHLIMYELTAVNYWHQNNQF